MLCSTLKRKFEKLIKNFLRSSCDRFEAQPVQGKPVLFCDSENHSLVAPGGGAEGWGADKA